MSTSSSVDRQEQLLQAWINMSLMIRGNRLVSGFSLNEMVICRILYARRQAGEAAVTATELCRKMHLLKSQINKILTSMENAGIIERVRSESDRRKIEIRMRDEAVLVYEMEHAHILKIMDHVCKRLGEKQAEELTVLLHEAVAAINELPTAE